MGMDIWAGDFRWIFRPAVPAGPEILHGLKYVGRSPMTKSSASGEMARAWPLFRSSSASWRLWVLAGRTTPCWWRDSDEEDPDRLDELLTADGESKSRQGDASQHVTFTTSVPESIAQRNSHLGTA